jgi:hypothetical protein
MESRYLESAMNILKNIHYITLATVCKDGSPWNTPVSAIFDSQLSFLWGSNPKTVHSENIRADSRTSVVIYDSTALEGTGEGVYFIGHSEEVKSVNDSIAEYRFVPERVWINDEAKDEKGEYSHDFRVELDLSALRDSFI